MTASATKTETVKAGKKALTTAERIRVARTEAGLMQKQLAEMCGVSQGDISRYERGVIAPNATQVDRIITAITKHLGHTPVALQAVDGALRIHEREEGKLHPIDVLAEPGDVEWIVEGVVARKAVTLFAAAPGTGKSLIAQALCVAIANGEESAGPWAINAKSAMVLDAENGPALVQRRMRGMGLTPEAVADGRITIYDADGFDIEADYETLRQLVLDIAPDFLVLDTWISLWSGSESSTDGVKRCLNGLRDLADEANCGILLLHHTTKGADTYRGSSAIAGTIEAVFMLLRDPNTMDSGARLFTCEKMRLDAEPQMKRICITTSGVEETETDPVLLAAMQRMLRESENEEAGSVV